MKFCTFLINLSFCQMRMEAELEDMAMEYERTHAAAIITEKRGKNFDKVCIKIVILWGNLLPQLLRWLVSGRRRRTTCTPSWTPATLSAATSPLRLSA